MQQAEDFRDESIALYELLRSADAALFDAPTQFKNWTFNAILKHLYLWNINAGLQVTDEAKLIANLEAIGQHEGGMRGFEADYFADLSGRDLLEAWRQNVDETADIFGAIDPKARLKWAGPDMSARSSITARLMETWAHGQAIYDYLGVVRQNADRIKNIVILGVNTFGWTYICRGETQPSQMPFLSLIAPSGAIWTFGEESSAGRIEGAAEDFCQVVTQCRNIADTDLLVTGDIAVDWMSKAQCFAGGPETPPPPGTRCLRQSA